MSANATPFDFSEARDAINAAKATQKQAEEQVRQAYREFGAARRAYQLAFGEEIVKARAENPATIALDLARAVPRVAELRFKKDVAEGVMEAARSGIWRHTADRRDLGRLVDWSRRVSPDGQDEEPAEPQPIHGRRAA